MPLFVLDASVAGAWALPDEQNSVAEAALDGLMRGEAVVPGIWWYEVRNCLVVNERRGRISKQETSRFLLDLSRQRILIDRLPMDHVVMDLARAHELSYYDAAYLELALRERLPLATIDKPLRRASEACRVELLGA